jgi:hypothetical protein
MALGDLVGGAVGFLVGGMLGQVVGAIVGLPTGEMYWSCRSVPNAATTPEVSLLATAAALPP